MHHKFLAAVAALSLSAALLAGCASSSSSSMASSTATSEAGSASSATSEAGSSSAAAASDAAAPGYDSAKVTALLDKTISYEADTAGGSLHAASAAADLVSYLSANGADNSDKLVADAQTWMNGLSDEKKAVLKMNWPTIRDTAKSIATDAAGQADMLDSAGVTTDFTKMDLSKVTAAVESLDSVLGAM